MASCKYNPGINSVNPYAVLNVTQQSQNVSNNTSVVRWELILYRPSVITGGATKNWNVTVDGETKRGTTTIAGSGTKSIASGTKTIAHDGDGSKTISFNFNLQFDITWSGKFIATGSASGTMSLSTIPRATTPTLDKITADLGTTITVTLKAASSSFTHKLYHDFWEGTWTQMGTTYGANATAGLAMPLDWATRIPDRAQGNGRIRCVTYNGSNVVGEKIVTFYANVPATVKPVVNDITVKDDSASIASKFSAFVQSRSALDVIVDAEGAYGSTIKNCVVGCEGKNYNGANITTQIISGSGQIPVTVTVTDTRGRKDTYTKMVSVLPYSPPLVNTFSVQRTNASYQPDETGAYALITLDFAITPLNNLNDKAYTVYRRKKGDTAWTTVQTGSVYTYSGDIKVGAVFDTDYPHEARVVVEDFFTQTEVVYDNIPTGTTVYDIHDSGLSICFGGVSQRGADERAIDFKMDVYDKFGARINNGLARYTDNSTNAIDPNTTIEELILTNKNTPESGKMMYISTVFYNGKSATVARSQLARPYSADGSLWERYYYGGKWSAWKRYVAATEIPQILTGTKLFTSHNSSSALMFTLSQLQTMFGVTDGNTNHYFASFVNGDAANNDAHVDGASWVGTNLFAVFDRTATGAIRVNYVLFYKP